MGSTININFAIGGKIPTIIPGLNYNIPLGGHYFQSILPTLAFGQPACNDAVRQGGKGDMSQKFPHIDKVRQLRYRLSNKSANET